MEAHGGPLSVVVKAANVNDQKMLRETIENIVVERPLPRPWKPQHLCLDAGYDNPTGREVADEFEYRKHIRPARKTEEKAAKKRFPPRRWVVERTLGWLSRCRAILVRFAKKAQNYLGLIQLACALLWYRRLSIP